MPMRKNDLPAGWGRLKRVNVMRFEKSDELFSILDFFIAGENDRRPRFEWEKDFQRGDVKGKRGNREPRTL